jgi:hypothetical protein
LGGVFPLTPALSLGEREKSSQRFGKLLANNHQSVNMSGCSFSPREKVRMRGNGH